MSVQTLQTIFVSDLEELIFPELAFANFSQNHDSFVIGNQVSVPNYVGDVAAEKNPTQSGTPTVRSDEFVNYNIDFYGTHPTRIDIKDELQTNYALRSSTIEAHSGSLIERAKDGILYAWADGVSAANTFETTGASSSDNLANGATGERAKLTKEDLRNVAKKMDKDRMPKMGRYIAIPADMYYELFSDGEILTFDNNNNKPMPEGVITKLFGLNIIPMDQVIYYDDATLTLPTDIGDATAGTLHHGCLAWSSAHVAKAFKAVEVYLEERDPKNFGASFFSAGMLYGAKALRGSNLDNSGVYAIKQA